MYDSKKELLELLQFGNVDSESEENLDNKFIKTRDFNEFLDSKKALILGAKGSGKSALFQMFAKYESKARLKFWSMLLMKQVWLCMRQECQKHRMVEVQQIVVLKCPSYLGLDWG